MGERACGCELSGRSADQEPQLSDQIRIVLESFSSETQVKGEDIGFQGIGVLGRTQLPDSIGIQTELRDASVHEEMELTYSRRAALLACALAEARTVLNVVGERSVASARQMAMEVV
jgi:hypothetical protein